MGLRCSSEEKAVGNEGHHRHGEQDGQKEGEVNFSELHDVVRHLAAKVRRSYFLYTVGRAASSAAR